MSNKYNTFEDLKKLEIIYPWSEIIEKLDWEIMVYLSTKNWRRSVWTKWPIKVILDSIDSLINKIEKAKKEECES